MASSDPQRDVILETLAYTLVGRLLVHYKHSMLPSEADWDSWIAQRSRPDHDAVLVTGSKDMSAPNSTQRMRLMLAMDAVGHRQMPVAVVVHSGPQRAVFKVFQWLAGGRSTILRAFPPEALAETLAWLGVNERLEDVEKAIARLASALVRP
jgi:hypothetical protein